MRPPTPQIAPHGPESPTRDHNHTDAARAPLHQKDDGLTGRLWTAAELADRWQVSTGAVYRMAREGRVPSVSIGRYYRFRPAAIEQWEGAHERSADG